MHFNEGVRETISELKTGKTDIGRELRGRTVGYILTAFGLVAGLAWNEAITSLIEYIFPLSRNTISAKLIYAVVITMVMVIMGSYLVRLTREHE